MKIRLSWWGLVSWAFLLASVAAIAAIAFVVHMYYVSMETLVDCYAVDFASNLFVECLSDNPERWPTGWSDLDGFYEAVKKANGYELSADELKERVKIDFSVTRQQFLDNPQLRIIALSKGGLVYLSGADPNERIRNWLKVRETEPDSRSKSSGRASLVLTAVVWPDGSFLRRAMIRSPCPPRWGGCPLSN